MSVTKTATFEGEWRGETAGGSIEHHTARLCPQVILRVKGPVAAHIMLEFRGSPPPNAKLGFYILKGEIAAGYPVLSFGKDSLIAKTEFGTKVEAKVPVDNTVRFTIVPCTQLPGEEAQFKLTVSCACDDPSFLSLEEVKNRWQTVKVAGEWKQESAGGCANYPGSFLKNPQYLLKVAQRTRVSLLLTQAPADVHDTIGFYIAKTETGLALKELTRKELVAKSTFASRREALKSQELDPGSYIVIPCTFDPGYINKFQMTVFVDNDVSLSECERPVDVNDGSPASAAPRSPTSRAIDEMTEQELSQFPASVSTKGEWALKNDTAGGCMNHSSWRKNPQFFLTVVQTGEFLIRLVQDDKKNKRLLNTIGFYIAKGDGRRKLTVVARDLVGKSNFKRTAEVACRVKLEATPKPYIIIPCTFKPDVNASFELFANSKTEGECILAPCTHKWNNITLRDDWKGKSAGGCRNNPTWVNNPQFYLRVLKPCNILIIAQQPTEKPSSHGFYVFDSSGSPTGNIFYQEETKLVTKSIFIDDEEVWKELDLYVEKKEEAVDFVETDSSKDAERRERAHTRIMDLDQIEQAKLAFVAKQYTIVPCTFDPRVERPIVMSVYYDGDPANVTFTQVPPIQLKETKVQGSWEQHTSGGCINFTTTFKNNPHYYFRTSHTVKATIVLMQHPHTGQPTNTIGFYVTTTGETGRRLLKMDRTLLIAKSSFINKSYVWIEFDMEANEKYVIVPCTFSPRVLCQYTLAVYTPSSSPIIPSLYAPPDDWVFNSLEGEWRGESAAGSKDFSEKWRKNPSFRLQVSKDTTILNVFLSQQNDIPLPIGFYILKGVTKEKAGKVDKATDKAKAKQKIIERSDFIRTTEVSLENIKLKKGNYTIVVSCLLQNQEGYFTLTTYSDKEILLEPLEEKAVGSEDKRHQVAAEMLSTEKTYVSNLELVTKCYMEPLKALAITDEGKEKGISPQTIRLLFSNTAILLKYNQTLLVDLQSRLTTWGRNSKLGDIFMKMASFLMIYSEYCNGYPQAIATFRELRKNEDLAGFFQQCQANTGLKLTLGDFLIMPVQRIPRYVMLLKELLKHTPNDHPDYADLVSARFKIEQITQALDAKKQQAENMAKLMALSDCITKKGNVRVAEPYRRYIREGNITVERDGKKALYHVFLFSDAIFLTTASKKAEKYRYVDRVDFKEGTETIISGVDTSLPDFGFLLTRKRTQREQRVRGFYASSEEDKTAWVIDIKSQLHDLDVVRSVAVGTN